MSTLYVTDLDGTFLGADAHVSDVSARLISDAVRRGALFTVATARTPATVVPLLKNTLTSASPIVMTGAAFWHREKARYVDARLLEADDARLIISILETYGCHPFVYALTGDGLLHVYHGARTLSRVEQRFVDDRQGLSLKRFYLNARVTDADADSVVLIFAMGEKTSIQAAAQALAGRTDAAISQYTDTYNDGIALLEVFAPGVSKANAVLTLKKRVGADRLVVFGDNLNDLPMMAVADQSIAVANALPEVQAAADLIIDANTTDAVARHIAANTH